MNERIEHFAERATKEMDQEAFSEDMNIPAEWYHKFAELIVRECMGLCYRIDTEYEGKKVKSTVIASKVAEHFGVEK